MAASRLPRASDAADAPEPSATSGTPRWQKAVGVLGVVVLVVVGTDLYDVVTSSGERPTGGHGPAPGMHGDEPTVDPPGTDHGDRIPPGFEGDDGHDPSMFDH